MQQHGAGAGLHDAGGASPRGAHSPSGVKHDCRLRIDLTPGACGPNAPDGALPPRKAAHVVAAGSRARHLAGVKLQP